jgi:hypothetical protein
VSWQTTTPSDDVEAADWIRERLFPFNVYRVGSVVPSGFAAYARIFHPAWTSRDWNPEEVSWTEVAAWAGRKVHPEMQFHSIATPAEPNRSDDQMPWTGEPRLGVLSKPQARALIDLLPSFTSTPDDCWFCLWDGYGYVSGAVVSLSAFKQGPPPDRPRRPPRWHLRMPFPKAPGVLPDRKRVRLPGRHYLLFRGPIAKAEGWEDGPNLWWPDDHAWCVASEIDHPYSYVGGSQELIDAIDNDPAIEALPATDTDGITYSSDKVNG